MKCIIRCRHDEQITAERDFRLAQRKYSRKSERERWLRRVFRLILRAGALIGRSHIFENLLQNLLPEK